MKFILQAGGCNATQIISGLQTMHIMANALINEQIRRADVAIRMNPHQFFGKDHSHEQLIAAGYAAAMRAWPKIASMMV